MRVNKLHDEWKVLVLYSSKTFLNILITIYQQLFSCYETKFFFSTFVSNMSDSKLM